jgi:type 1 glutamine amidotransferase
VKLVVVMLAGFVLAGAPGAADRVLIYTRNGQGYVHDNIQAGVDAIRKIADATAVVADVSDDPGVFTPDNLKRYRAVIFANSNNEAFLTDAQRYAFQLYLRGGGGFAGLHSASGSERQWPYFWEVLGGKFVRHPKMQKFTVRVKDPTFPATRGLPATFEWTDECYYHDHIAADIHPILVTDPAALDDPQKAVYPGDRFGDALPLAWYHNFDGGREFYLALGHNQQDYTNPTLIRLIQGGILWAIGRKP